MAEEFEDRDLTGASFWGGRLRDATMRDVDFTGVRTHHVILHDVEIDGHVDRLVINGVDVTDHVKANDPWEPLRSMSIAGDIASIAEACVAMQAAWDDTLAEAADLTEAQRRERVNGEWSLVETLRHLVFATDKWFTAPIAGGDFHALGMPNSGSVDFPWPGLDLDAEPIEADVLAARRENFEAMAALLADMGDERLAEVVEVPESGRARVLDCWHAVLEEEFEHLRYARRDLAILRGG